MMGDMVEMPSIYRRLIRPTPVAPVTLHSDQPWSIKCKLEYLNPSGSTKDRLAAFILGKEFEAGRIGRDQLIVEASSGSTSIAMAMVCAQMGLRFCAVMSRGVSSERVQMIKAYGGEVEFSPQEKGIMGAIEMAAAIERQRGAYWPRQFENVDNVTAHRAGTAVEIAPELAGGEAVAVVSGVGTGGTLMGIYLGLRDRRLEVVPVAAYPVKRSALSAVSGCFSQAECCSFSGRIPGVVDRVSKLFVPENLPGLLEIEVNDDAAIETTRRLMRAGFPVGPSSGLNYAAAVEVQRRLGHGTRVVTVFADRMERYFSTELFKSES